MIAGSWVRDRGVGVARLWPRRVRSWQTAAWIVGLALLGGLGFTWYRGSSFVRIERVSVTGLSGPDVSRIRRELTDAARRMTTLDVNLARLESVVAPYGFVRRLTVTSRGAHGVIIRVVEQVPVAILTFAGRSVVVGADGRLVPRGSVHAALPTVPVRAMPVGGVVGGGAGAAVRVLAAAPYPLLARIANATISSPHGVIVQLRAGPQIYFGPALQLERKWRAAIAVLQDSGSARASYVDVTDPQRPVAGAGVSPGQAAALGLAGPPVASSPSGSSAAPTTASTAAGAAPAGG
ncbi:MAG TPA: hypothetical protein VFN36_06610 [Solirubrobacteraceae bacterium]|nr:hypothetical protein [Solirubrobacteraceae bacterium]